MLAGKIQLPPQFMPRNIQKIVLLLLPIVGLTFYGRSWGSYFVCDDYEFLGRINFHTAAAYWGKSWAYGDEYRPLRPYSHAVDAALSGENPVGYHITNTLTHLGSAYLLIMIGIALELPFWTASRSQGICTF